MKFSGFIFSAEDQYTQQERYDFIFEVAKFLDENGYTALWTPERHFQEFGGSFPNPAVLSAALAASTKKLHLRAGSVVAPHHHSVRIAEDWALVDQISKGRTGVCFASGWHKRDFVFFPENYQNRKEIMFEQIKQVQSLWNGESQRFSLEGEELEINSYPETYQKNIPIWLVFSSDPAIWCRAGELGFNVLGLLNGWEMIEENIKIYRDARQKAGFNPDEGIVTIGVHTFIGETNEEVLELVEQPLKSYLSTFLLAKNDDKKLSSQQAPMSEDEKNIILQGVFYDLYNSRALLGDINKCKKVVERLKSIGVNEIACLIDFGVEFDKVLSALTNLTVLKDLFGTKQAQIPIQDKVTNEQSFDWYYNR